MKFLKLNFSTLMLPAILIVMYIIVTNYMYTYAALGDTYMCNIMDLGKILKQSAAENNSVLFEQTQVEIREYTEEWQEKTPQSDEVFSVMGTFLEKINP
jgi:predicted nucleic acid-binding protein